MRAAEELWRRYQPCLLRLASQCLKGASRSVSDEDDVIQSAFWDFYRGFERGQYDAIRDRQSLWKMLATITARRAANKRRDDARLKRFGASRQQPGGAVEIEGVCSAEASPAAAVITAELVERLLRALGDHRLRRIVLPRIEGYTVDEIALELCCVPRTVRRKLVLIRDLWQEQLHVGPVAC